MPTQTTKSGFIYFPDGCKVQVKPSGGAYSDIGVLKGTAKAALQWKENKVSSANKGTILTAIKDMIIEGSMNLFTIDPDRIKDLAGGVLTSVATPGSENSSIPDQVIATGWDDNTKYELIAYTSGSDSTPLKLPTKPTLTSVTLDATGTPEVLTEIGAGASGDYMVIHDSDAISGWSIIFNSAGMSTGSPKTKDITINYGANTPTARTTYYAGTSVMSLAAVAIKFEHTDSASLVRGLEIFSANPKSGFNFDFKGADEDGVEEMAISFTGEIDTTLTDGRQLMSWYIDTGAE